MDWRSIWTQIEKILVRYRVHISFVVFFLLILEDVLEQLVPRKVLSLSDHLGLCGSLLVLLGMFIRSWASGVIHKTQRLAMTGPYSLTRHPLYVGSFFIAVGFSIILWDNENLWAVLVMVPLLYWPAVRQEEARLAKRFAAQWSEYTQRTGLFYPRELPNVRSEWSLSQWLRNREYQLFLASCCGLVVLHVMSQR